MTDSILRIASRKSDLARLQSFQVAESVGKKFPEAKIEFRFSDSLGDTNQHDPLWRMPEKGVFTSDLTKGLVEKKWDAVVHSWKDLPTEENAHTEIVATLPRADARDLLLLPMSVSLDSALITILSSSPRREFNIKSFLADHWPKQNTSTDFNFVPVRGNIKKNVCRKESGIDHCQGGC
jgi:hydroxymethylbilane synthase